MSAAGISISFAPQIDAYAKNNGLDLSSAGADILDAVLRSALKTDGNRASFVIGTDRTGTIEEALALHTEGTPRKSKVPPAHVGVGPGANPTERAIATNANRRTPVSEARAAEAVKLVGQYGNPWKTGNSTHRAIVMNKNPDLANQLKSEAEVR